MTPSALQTSEVSAECGIRPPRGIECRICRMLLPEMDDAPGPVWHRVAVDPSDGRVVGAIGVWEDLTMQPRWAVNAHVIPPARRRGIARALVDAIADEAGQRGVGAIDSWLMPEEASPLGERIRQLGFRVEKRVFEYEVVADEIMRAAQNLYDRVRDQRKIPASARLVSLHDAEPRQVIEFHTRHLGGVPSGIMPWLNGREPGSLDPHLSLVLLVDDRVMGLALGHCRADPDIFEFDATVIHPALRGGWAAAWIRYEHARRVVARGCTKARYMTFDQKLGDRHTGARASNRLIRITQQMRREVASAAPAPNPAAAGGASCSPPARPAIFLQDRGAGSGPRTASRDF